MATTSRSTTSRAKRKREEFIGIEEGWEILEEQAQKHLGMSAKEFVRAWNAGEFPDPDRRPEVMRVVALLPFAR